MFHLLDLEKEGVELKVRWAEDRAGGLSPLSEKYAWLQQWMDESQQMLYGDRKLYTADYLNKSSERGQGGYLALALPILILNYG